MRLSAPSSTLRLRFLSGLFRFLFGYLRSSLRWRKEKKVNRWRRASGEHTLFCLSTSWKTLDYSSRVKCRNEHVKQGPAWIWWVKLRTIDQLPDCSSKPVLSEREWRYHALVTFCLSPRSPAVLQHSYVERTSVFGPHTHTHTGTDMWWACMRTTGPMAPKLLHSQWATGSRTLKCFL